MRSSIATEVVVLQSVHTQCWFSTKLCAEPPNKPGGISGCLIDGFVCHQSEQLSAVSEEASICLGHPCCVSRYICLGVNTPFAWWNWFTQEGTSIWNKLNFPKCLEGEFLHCKISYLHIHDQFMLKWKYAAPCTVLKHTPPLLPGSVPLKNSSLNWIQTSAPTAATGGSRARARCVTIRQSGKAYRPHPACHENVQA